MLSMTQINNNKVQVSIVEIQGENYILYLHTVGMFKCTLENLETRERATSGVHANAPDAVTDAYEQLYHRRQSNR